jgi:transcriptional regulatory protein LevR
MNIISINGSDEIADLMTRTLHNTTLAMVNEGLITREIADKFISSHVASLAPDTSFFRCVMKRIFGVNLKDNQVQILICKITNTDTPQQP